MAEADSFHWVRDEAHFTQLLDRGFTEGEPPLLLAVKIDDKPAPIRTPDLRPHHAEFHVLNRTGIVMMGRRGIDGRGAFDLTGCGIDAPAKLQR
jgi:hypothetical protein